MSSLRKHTVNAYCTRNRVRLIKGGHRYFEMLVSLIEKSQLHVHLQFYIFLDDTTGRSVIDAMKAAAARGVQVFLHIDAYASQALPRKTISEMKEAGIHVKRFEPLLRSRHFYFGRRLHHKVVVVDGIYSLVGGRNVSDKYNDMPGEPAWMDFAVYCEGEASLTLLLICRQLWKGQKRLPKLSRQLMDEFYDKIEVSDHTEVRIRRNDWVKRKNEVYKSYADMFDHANDRITIMCSYFLPGMSFRRKMQRAVRRGVDIKVILAGVSDISVSKNAERYLYNWMLKNRIGIYEYQPTILHAKTAVFDYKWTTIGSYNVNNISAHASLELNIDIRDSKFTTLVQKELDNIIETHCEQITAENYKRSTNFLKRVWQHTCYLFVNNILKLFTFYFRQEE
jgi:cardiolipin synthase